MDNGKFGIGSTRSRDASGTLADDDRAVSVAVNHVLAIGITTILITTLLFGAGNVLGQQSDRATQNQLRTIGDRLASQVTTAEAMAERRGGGVVLETNHPNNIVGSGYTVELVSGTDCADVSSTGCLRLTVADDGTTVTTPVDVSGPIVRSEVSGGAIAIVYDASGVRLVERAEAASVGAGVPAPADQPGVDPIGGAVGETRTQYAPGGGGGGGGPPATTTSGGSGPQLASTSIDDVSSNPPGRAEYEVDYTVTNTGNYDRVAIAFTNEDSGYTDWRNQSDTSTTVSYSRSGNPKGYQDEHTITIYVFDDDDNIVDTKCWNDAEADSQNSNIGNC